METTLISRFVCAPMTVLVLCAPFLLADEPVTRAVVDGQGPDWKSLTGDDFVNVNCAEDTWKWKEGVAYCTGKPVGVIRSKNSLSPYARLGSNSMPSAQPSESVSCRFRV